MNISQFIDLRNKVQSIYKECEIVKLREESYKHSYELEVQFQGKKTTFIIDNRMSEEWQRYQMYDAINSITDVLEDITPLEYTILEDYFIKFETFEKKEEKEKTIAYLDYGTTHFDKKFEYLKRYLGDDYEVPKEIYEYINQKKEELLPINIDSFESSQLEKMVYFYRDRKYVLGGSEVSEIANEESIKLIKSILDLKEDKETNKTPMLVFRIMSDEELIKLEQDGLVTNIGYEGIREWDMNNKDGMEGFYSFGVVNNREDALLNFASIIQYFKETILEYSDKDANLVFMKSDFLSEDMIFEGEYKGLMVVDESDSPGLYGRDSSKEFAVPYYSKSDFKIVEQCKVNSKNIEEKFEEYVKKLNIYRDTDVLTQESKIYNDYLNYFTTISEDDVYYDIEDNNERKQSRVKSLFTNYLESREKEDDDILGIENLSEDLSSCMQKLKSKYELNEHEIFCVESDALQKLKYWYYVWPCGKFAYEEELDENESIISEKDIKDVVMDSSIDRTEGQSCLTELIKGEQIK